MKRWDSLVEEYTRECEARWAGVDRLYEVANAIPGQADGSVYRQSLEMLWGVADFGAWSGRCPRKDARPSVANWQPFLAWADDFLKDL